MRSRPALVATAAASMALAAPAFAQPPPAAPVPLAIAEYGAALDALRPIGNVVFEYTQTRIGPARALTEVHRVYRSAEGEERNETISVDGEPIVPVIAHIASVATWPYDVHAFAVDPAEYDIMPLGAAIVAGKRASSFSAVRTSSGDFAVTKLFLDPVRHLPVRETFDTQGGGCTGSGTIDFAPVDHRWMPTIVAVSCKVADGSATFKETIKFGAYRFLTAMPSDVFGAPIQ